MPLADFEYHGAIVVVEMTTDEIVFVHPGQRPRMNLLPCQRAPARPRSRHGIVLCASCAR